jgi:(+)-pinoresinol hydroxylase
MKNLNVVPSGLLIALCASPAFAQQAPVERGKQVYDYWCATCHGAGSGHPGTQSLEVKYKGTGLPAQLAERTDLTADMVRFFGRNGLSVMPIFRKTEVSDADLDAVVAYLTRPRPAPTGVPGSR